MGQCHWLKLLFLIPGPSSPSCGWVAEQLQHTHPFPWPPAQLRSAGADGWAVVRMTPALLLLLSLASCSLLQGMLLRPRHVRLEAKNFHVWLHWEPDPSSPSSATYEVEWRNSNCWPPQVVLATPGPNPQHKHHHTTHSLPEKNWFLQASQPRAAEAVVLAAPVRGGPACPTGALQTEQEGSALHLWAPEAQHTVLCPDGGCRHCQGAEPGG